jgi:hypothetical protein
MSNGYWRPFGIRENLMVEEFLHGYKHGKEDAKRTEPES